MDFLSVSMWWLFEVKIFTAINEKFTHAHLSLRCRSAHFVCRMWHVTISSRIMCWTNQRYVSIHIYKWLIMSNRTSFLCQQIRRQVINSVENDFLGVGGFNDNKKVMKSPNDGFDDCDKIFSFRLFQRFFFHSFSMELEDILKKGRWEKDRMDWTT